MSRCRFVQPEVVRLSLTDGDFIDVKRRLNTGEQRKLFGSLVKDMHPGEKLSLIPELVGLTKLVAYIVGWSFVDAERKPVPVSEAAINNLDSETFKELIELVDEHEEQQTALRDAEKNVPAGVSAPSAILKSAE